VAPLLAGLQTVPSVTWFPLAILLFQLSEQAIQTVVVLGATPCIAMALLDSFDRVPPVLVKAGRSLGLEGFGLFRHVLLPAAMPGFVSGVKQGWAFAWRSLMAGELLVLIGDKPSLGAHLHFARELSDAEGLLAWLVVVLGIGILVDVFVFRTLEDALHRRMDSHVMLPAELLVEIWRTVAAQLELDAILPVVLEALARRLGP
jgi:NitT/TauT family transport system permease protein